MSYRNYKLKLFQVRKYLRWLLVVRQILVCLNLPSGRYLANFNLMPFKSEKMMEQKLGNFINVCAYNFISCDLCPTRWMREIQDII